MIIVYKVFGDECMDKTQIEDIGGLKIDSLHLKAILALFGLLRQKHFIRNAREKPLKLAVA